MKKRYISLVAGLSFAAAVQAQSNVTLYGVLDLGIRKTQFGNTEIKRGDNNRLGVRGTEDLGNGTSVFFVLESRFEPDTGTVEGGNRPLFQGQTRLGVTGALGSISAGRWLTAVQQNQGAFDAFEGRTLGDMGPYILTKFDSEGAYAANHIANAVFYSSPWLAGFKIDASVATKEAVTGSSFVNTVNPYSITAGYTNGAFRTSLGYELNGKEDEFAAIGALYDFGFIKVNGSYSRDFPLSGVVVTGVAVSASVPVGAAGSVKLAYGQFKPSDTDASTKYAVGYWHTLSKRTAIYTDVVRLTDGVTHQPIMAYDLGVRHTF